MYVGRIVGIGANLAGQACGLYRVSSRSFPNREAVALDQAIAILPKEGHENDIYKNPYIAYNCLRVVGSLAVVTNGSHTDPIAAKLQDGVNPRDALVQVLHGMDFEHDSLDTPRIAGIVDRVRNVGWLGIVTRDSVLVKWLPLQAGKVWYVATYDHTMPGLYSDNSFDVADADAACRYVMGEGVFADLERPITAACAVATTDDGYDLALLNGTKK